jgi:hypothetical protein
MSDWKREVAQSQVVFREDGKAYSGADYFCADGFFPYYTRQKTKILFISTEADFYNPVMRTWRGRRQL